MRKSSCSKSSIGLIVTGLILASIARVESIKGSTKKQSKINIKRSYDRHGLSYLNAYLCATEPSNDVQANLGAISKFDMKIRKFGGTDEQRYLLHKTAKIIELNNLANSKDICSQEGQNKLQSLSFEVMIHRKYVIKSARLKAMKAGKEHDFDPLSALNSDKCQRIEPIYKHIDSQRKQVCENDGYFAKALAESYDSLRPKTQKLLTGAMSIFMEMIIQQLGDFNMQTCKRNLANEIDSLDGTFDALAAETLLQGLEMVCSSDEQLVKGEHEEEAQFLRRFVKLRNENLVQPCRKYVKKLSKPIHQMRLYESMFGSEGEVKFVASEPSSRRFYRAWALYNTCVLLEARIARLSVDLLYSMGFNVKQAKMDKKSMVAILKSYE